MMDQNIQKMSDDLSGCERIRYCPWPVAFIVHMRFFMILWLVTLPMPLGNFLSHSFVHPGFVLGMIRLES